jgi:hypothetical protein
MRCSDTTVCVQTINLDGQEISEAQFVGCERFDADLQTARADIKKDLRAEVPALADMLWTIPAVGGKLVSAGPGAHVAVFRHELQRLRAQARH